MPTVAEHALSMIADGMTLGLGTGRAASAFIEALGERVRRGLSVRGVPTSEASAALARAHGIPVVSLEEAGELDIAFDGADEVDPHLDLIKGYGGALVREKIVAASASQFVVLVGEEKLVDALGQRGRLPVEVVPFGLALTQRRLRALGFVPVLRASEAAAFISDNGNYILDCQCRPSDRWAELESAMLETPGVVDTGLFRNMASVVLVQSGERVVEKSRSPKR